MNFQGTFHAGRNYAIYQFLLWICSNSKFFEVTGCIFLSAWGVRSCLFFFHCLCWTIICILLKHSALILRHQFSPWVWNVITWENAGLVLQVHSTEWYFSCTGLVLWRKAENYALHWEGTFLLQIQGSLDCFCTCLFIICYMFLLALV